MMDPKSPRAKRYTSITSLDEFMYEYCKTMKSHIPDMVEMKIMNHYISNIPNKFVADIRSHSIEINLPILPNCIFTKFKSITHSYQHGIYIEFVQLPDSVIKAIDQAVIVNSLKGKRELQYCYEYKTQRTGDA